MSAPSGQGVNAVHVMAYVPGQSPGTWSYRTDTFTAADGTYQLSELTSGPHRLAFIDGAGAYVVEYFDNARTIESATTIQVVSGQAVTGRDVRLVPFARITGTVRRTDGVGLGNIEVQAVVPRQGGGWVPVGGDQTAGDGTYAIEGLPTGTYRVTFRNNGNAFLSSYISESYNDKATTEEAEDIAVSEGSTRAGIDAVMVRKAILGGTVTNTLGDPLSNIWVQAFQDVDPGPDVLWASTHVFTTTDSSGEYAITLPTGGYRLGFSTRPGADAVYLPEFYDNATTLNAAQEVRVTNELTTTLPAVALVAGGRISGSLTDQSGAPVFGMIAVAYRRGQVAGQTTWTREASILQTSMGSYSLGGLPPGTYRMEFVNSTSSTGYLPEFFNDVATIKDATDIVVAPEQQVAGIDAVLTATATITGNVSNPAFTGRAYRVEAYSSPDGGATWQIARTYLGDAFVDSHGNGDYTLSGLPAGTYRIKFDEDNPGELQTEFYNDAPSIKAAEDITVVAGQTRVLDAAVLADEEPSVMIENVVLPTLTGGHLVGATLRIGTGTWTPGGLGFAYQWLRNGTPISGATGPTRVLTLSDRGKVISARVTASKAGLERSTATTRATETVQSVSALAVLADPGRARVAFRIRVTSRDIVPTGSVVVMVGTRTVATLQLLRGAVATTLERQRRGPRSYTFAYSGDARVAGSDLTKQVTIG